MSMKERIEPLIADRAPWLFSGRPFTGIARVVLNTCLGYREVLALSETYKDLPSRDIFADIEKRIARKVTAKGLTNIPKAGGALIVANHPTGIADGVVLSALISQCRKDAYFYANGDILHVLPQLADRIIPVEWRLDRRTHAKTRETLALTRKAVAENRIGVIFPSGRLAKRRGRRLYERDWMQSAAMIAKKFDLPIIPVHIQSRNSALFYLFDALHPTLRDITLFHETLNKATQPYRLTFGEAISPHALPRSPQDAIQDLRAATLKLGEIEPRKLPFIEALNQSLEIRA